MNLTKRFIFNSLLAFSFGLIAAFSCTPAPDPGQLGGECVDVDLCDFGLVCSEGICTRGSSPSAGLSDAAAGSDAALSGPAGGASSDSGAGGGPGTPSGGSGGASGGSGGALGGAGGAAGGSEGVGGSESSGGTTGIGGSGSGTTCVGIPSVRGRCNRNACLCPASAECFPRAAATDCCSVAPECG